MTTCTRILEFDYGHRVLGHKGKCSSLHGHRGKVEITCSEIPTESYGIMQGIIDVTTQPDSSRKSEDQELGMIIDFGKVKEIVGGWIDEVWDHRMLLNVEDPMLIRVAHTPENWKTEYWREVFGPRGCWTMKGNPTAENLARELYNAVSHQLAVENIILDRVRFWETPNCYADFIPRK